MTIWVDGNAWPYTERQAHFSPDGRPCYVCLPPKSTPWFLCKTPEIKALYRARLYFPSPPACAFSCWRCCALLCVVQDYPSTPSMAGPAPSMALMRATSSTLHYTSVVSQEVVWSGEQACTPAAVPERERNQLVVVVATMRSNATSANKSYSSVLCTACSGDGRFGNRRQTATCRRPP